LETTFDINEGRAKDKWNQQAQKGKVTGTYNSEKGMSGDREYEMSDKDSMSEAK